MIYPLLPCQNCNDGSPEWIGRPTDPNFCTCPTCGLRREQDYSAKGVQLDSAALSVWCGDDAVSLRDSVLPTVAKERSEMMAREGGADLGNCIDQKTGETRFRNRQQAEKFRAVKSRLRREGKLPG